MQQAFGDAQTTIACLAAGVTGAATDAACTYVVGTAGGASAGVGATGLEFCFRAVASAATFALVQRYMPDASANVFFHFLFFTTNRGLVNSAAALSRAAVSAVTGAVRTQPMRRGAVPATNPTNVTVGCGDAPCNKQ